jgi:hypothetical protein
MTPRSTRKPVWWVTMSITQFARQELDFELSLTQSALLNFLYGEPLGSTSEHVCTHFYDDGRPCYMRLSERDIISYLGDFKGSRIRPGSDVILSMGRMSGKTTLSRLIEKYETQRVTPVKWGQAPAPVARIQFGFANEKARLPERGETVSLAIFDELAHGPDDPWKTWMTYKLGGYQRNIALTTSADNSFLRLAEATLGTVLQVPAWMANPASIPSIQDNYLKPDLSTPEGVYGKSRAFRVEVGGQLR